MITIRHRDGRTIEVDIPDGAAVAIKACLAPGWGIGRMVTAPLFQEIAPSPPAEKAPRKRKEVKPPEDGVKATVLAFFAPGVKATKAAFVAESSMATDTASNAIDWLVEAGQLVREAKSYRAKVPA